MNKLYQSLPSNAQAAFAGLDVAARQYELGRSVADAPGGFAKKTVAGRVYWYYRLKNADGELVQIYIGPDDAATRNLIAAHKDPARLQGRAALVRMARAALEYGCGAIPEPHRRVIDRLAAHGFFRREESWWARMPFWPIKTNWAHDGSKATPRWLWILRTLDATCHWHSPPV